jgi:ABC-2 type transport system permease protein
MTVAFKYALAELMRFRKLAIWLAISLLALVFAIGWKSMDSEVTPLQTYINVSSLLCFRVLPLACAIFTTAVLTHEVDRKTIVYLFTRSTPRPQLLVGRFLASALVGVMVGIACLLMAYLGSGVAIGKINLLRDMGVVSLGGVAYSSIFLFMSLIVRKAMVACVLFAYGWESLTSNLSVNAQYLSVVSHMRNLTSRNLNEEDNMMLRVVMGVLPEDFVKPIGSVLIMIVLSLILVSVSCYWIKSHEYTPREDVS